MASVPSRPDPWQSLAALTAARIGLGRAGSSVPTRPLLQFQLAHARARDAVLQDLDVDALAAQMAATGFEMLRLASAAPDRATFIARPDLGRILDDASRQLLEARTLAAPVDCAVVIADGLSARAVMAHAVPLLSELRVRLAPRDWQLAPVSIVSQGRVAIGDEIGALLPARFSSIDNLLPPPEQSRVGFATARWRTKDRTPLIGNVERGLLNTPIRVAVRKRVGKWRKRSQFTFGFLAAGPCVG